MSVEIIQERLTAYGCTTTLEEEQALREITQEVILAGLGRTRFFSRAGFHGGTCLRIFHHLNRFSEDMDFALLEPDSAFALMPLLEQVCPELEAFGYRPELADRSRVGSAVKQAFIKDESAGALLNLDYRPRDGRMRKLRIKLEVDTNPPPGATYEVPVLDYPFPAAVRLFDLPSLFAGKIHAVLCRHYLKGRDWYDFIWYTARRTPINHKLLSASLEQQGPWQGKGVVTDDNWCIEALSSAIEAVDWRQARQDVQRFIRPRELPSLDLWTRDFFLAQCRKIGRV